MMPIKIPEGKWIVYRCQSKPMQSKVGSLYPSNYVELFDDESSALDFIKNGNNSNPPQRKILSRSQLIHQPIRNKLSDLAEMNGYKFEKKDGIIGFYKKGDVRVAICNTCGGGYVATVDENDRKIRTMRSGEAIMFLKKKEDVRI